MPAAEFAAVNIAAIRGTDYSGMNALLNDLRKEASSSEAGFVRSLGELNRLLDQRYPTGSKKRSSVTHLVNAAVADILGRIPRLGEGSLHAARLDKDTKLAQSTPGCTRLVIDATGFPIEGDASLARRVVDVCALGWKHILLFNMKGHRFIGCGLASLHPDCRIDVYGSPGDYLSSGLDGGEIYVHTSAQDQVGNIMKSGKLVIAGDVGQAFMYAAKGGDVFVLGNAAGRPLINAVGRPRVVINGTALDYLAESFMAGDPVMGGGFVIVNGMEYDLEGNWRDFPTPYPGGNLFSLASGGAVYLRDPLRKVEVNQLNGGQFSVLTPADWNVIRPMLEENERLLGIRISELLTIDGRLKDPAEVYRKVEPAGVKALKA